MAAGFAEILPASGVFVGNASGVLSSGGVVALPTETVYGLAASIYNEVALRQIFEVKGRPLGDPLIIHVLDFSSLLELVEMEEHLLHSLRQLVDNFCPGPLTFVLKKKKKVLDIITAGKKTVAVRIPAHPIFREVLRQTGPLAAPSANAFGYISPTCAEHVKQSIGDKIPLILDGGNCEIGIESTILDLSGKRFRVLRPGAITVTMIEEVLGEKIEPYRSIVSADPSAPGLLKRHYSPRTKLRLFKISPVEIVPDFYENLHPEIGIIYLSRDNALGDMDTTTGDKNSMEHHKRFRNSPKLEGFDLPESGNFKKPNRENSQKLNHLSSGERKNSIFWLSEKGNLREVANHLFTLLHRLDSMNFQMICCQIPGEKITETDAIGVAIYDRLSRAAAKF